MINSDNLILTQHITILTNDNITVLYNLLYENIKFIIFYKKLYILLLYLI